MDKYRQLGRKTSGKNWTPSKIKSYTKLQVQHNTRVALKHNTRKEVDNA